MKNLLLLVSVAWVLLIQSVQAQVAVKATYSPNVFSTYNSPLTGSARGLQVDYFISAISIQGRYTDLNNVSLQSSRVFGDDFSIGAAMNLPLVKTGGITVLLSPALGLGYKTKTFYNTGNLNELVGSHINVLTSVQLTTAVPVSPLTSLQFGVGISHSSNSKVALPNDGINKIEYLIGISRNVKYNAYTPGKDIYTEGINIELLEGFTGKVKSGYYVINGKGIYPDTATQGHSKPLLKEILAVNYQTPIGSMFGAKIGLELVYENTLYNPDHFFDTYQKGVPHQHLNPGIYTGADLVLNHLVLSATAGLHLDEVVYYTFSARYMFGAFGVEAKSYLNSAGAVGIVYHIGRE